MYEILCAIIWTMCGIIMLTKGEPNEKYSKEWNIIRRFGWSFFASVCWFIVLYFITQLV